MHGDGAQVETKAGPIERSARTWLFRPIADNEAKRWTLLFQICVLRNTAGGPMLGWNCNEGNFFPWQPVVMAVKRREPH